MKFNLIGSTAHWNISSGNAAHYIKRLDIPAVDGGNLLTYKHKIDVNSTPNIHNFHLTFNTFNETYGKTAKNPSTQTLFKTPHIIAYRQPPSNERILINSKVNSNTTTLSGNAKCDTKRCQICNLIDTRPDHLSHWQE